MIQDWVSIDLNSNKVRHIFRWDGEKKLPTSLTENAKVELYDEAIHPPNGVDLPVGPDWRAQYELLPPPPPKETPKP